MMEYHPQTVAERSYINTDTTLNRSIVHSARTAPYLARDEEIALAQNWLEKRDDSALHRITTAHMRLVISIAQKFRRYNLPMADLVQEGCVGLLEAAARFDPAREVRFSTYSSWWIRASMQDYVLKNWSIVRGGTSSAQKALFFNLRRLRTKLALENKNITKQEAYTRISEELGVSRADVETMDFRLSALDYSLNTALDQNEESGATKMDVLVDPCPLQDEITIEEIDSERRSVWLHNALKVLSERELEIITCRRLSDENETLEALGEKLGISKERVRQLESRAMAKLRGALLLEQDITAFSA